MTRPNPEGWVGGSEDFDCVWTFYGHRSQSTGAYLNDSVVDDDCDRGIADSNRGRHATQEGGLGCPAEP